MDVGAIEHVARARVPGRVPVVLSREEVGAVLKHVTGQVWLILVLLYGAGLRIQECLELRVKDLDFDRHRSSCAVAKDRRIAGRCCRWRPGSGFRSTCKR